MILFKNFSHTKPSKTRTKQKTFYSSFGCTLKPCFKALKQNLKAIQEEIKMADFASKGVGGAGLGLGIAGTALGLANGGLNNLLGNLGVGGNSNLINDMVGLSLASNLLGGKSCGCGCGCN